MYNYIKVPFCCFVFSLSQYMAFGLSGRDSFTFMEGADVTVAWVDNSQGPMAQDYHLRVDERTQVRISFNLEAC